VRERKREGAAMNAMRHRVRFVDEPVAPHCEKRPVSRESWSAIYGKPVDIIEHLTREELLRRSPEQEQKLGECDCGDFFIIDGYRGENYGRAVVCRRMLEMD
jgi:hypothetical protein